MRIIGGILNIVADNGNAGHGINKTRIMYEAMLSYAQLKDYLSVLVESGLLDCKREEDDGIYKITEKGTNFLRIYNEVSEYISA